MTRHVDMSRHCHHRQLCSFNFYFYIYMNDKVEKKIVERILFENSNILKLTNF